MQTQWQKLISSLSAATAGLFVLVLGSITAHAWGDGGHMIVATIAYERLNPTAKAEVDKLLAIVIDPASVTSKSTSFVEAAHWADDVRPLANFTQTADYHFIDNPFTMDNSDLPADLPKPDNVVKALDQYVATLKGNGTDQDKAEALRFVIHFVGDIHQPLHCATRVSSALPEGDRGGNDFMVSAQNAQGKRQKVKLHSLWDEGIGSFPRMGAHFQPPPVAEVATAAKEILNNCPDSDNGWKAGVPFEYEKWAAESTGIADSFVYKGLVAGQAPNATYVKAATAIAQKRVAWAGFRLAALLNTVWPDHP